MKKTSRFSLFVSTLVLALGIAVPGSAGGQVLDTNTSPPSLAFGSGIGLAFEALTTATNWTVAPFATIVGDEQTDKTLYGGGIAAIYNISGNAATMIRVEGLDGDFYMTGASLQLQLPLYLAGGKVVATAFGFVGGAYKFGGATEDGMIGIAGAGWDFKVPAWSKHWSCAFDVEYWSDRPGVQWRVAPVVWRF